MVDLKLPLYFLSTKHFLSKFSGNFDACACNPFQALPWIGAWFEAMFTYVLIVQLQIMYVFAKSLYYEGRIREEGMQLTISPTCEQKLN